MKLNCTLEATEELTVVIRLPIRNWNFYAQTKPQALIVIRLPIRNWNLSSGTWKNTCNWVIRLPIRNWNKFEGAGYPDADSSY